LAAHRDVQSVLDGYVRLSEVRQADLSVWPQIAGTILTSTDQLRDVEPGRSRSWTRSGRIEATLGPDDPILLHGGGNFGDVWPGFQRFREQVIRESPNRRIIQLPQTIH
jgi:exopolysaccharide biosynthesis predicted pyruvyltransferase EpsI